MDGADQAHNRLTEGAPPLVRTAFHHSCLCVVKSIRWFPVGFVLAVFFWSYYTFVLELVYLRESSFFIQIVYLLIYHALVIMFLWSFVMTIVTNPGTAPDNWKLSPDQISRLQGAHSEDEWKNQLQSAVAEMGVHVCQRSVQGAIRYCEVCFVIKPDRAHHCSVCETCILKMDHHCPWVNNCIGFGNYKFFLLFVTYGYAYCIFLIATTLSYTIGFWTEGLDEDGNRIGSIHILFLFFVSSVFFLFLSSLFWYHLFLLFFNRSTLEQFRTPVFVNCGAEKKSYHLGKMANFRQVFGSIPFQWCLPIYSTVGDGLSYPLNSRVSDTVVKECNNGGGINLSQSQPQPQPPPTPSASVVYRNDNASVRIDMTNQYHNGSGGGQGHGIGTQV